MLALGFPALYVLGAVDLALVRFAAVADVAELADALDSKSGIREDVWVRPPPSAPLKSGKHS
jgi:hypothetical protein